MTGDFTEPGLADWTVFLDLNNDGVADPSEPTALTNASGEYSFISLPAEWLGRITKSRRFCPPAGTFHPVSTAGKP